MSRVAQAPVQTYRESKIVIDLFTTSNLDIDTPLTGVQSCLDLAQ